MGPDCHGSQRAARGGHAALHHHVFVIAGRQAALDSCAGRYMLWMPVGGGAARLADRRSTRPHHVKR